MKKQLMIQPMDDFNIFIGYDKQNRMPAYTLADSILEHSSIPVKITFLHRNTLPMFTRPKTANESTDFSISRFLVPYLSSYSGWSLFLDNDMIVTTDIAELFNLRDPSYTVMCVKHNQVCTADTKFLGNKQHQYKFKNWSSVLLFNNEKCQILTPEIVNTQTGMYLHQFKWIDNLDQIGTLPLEWNYLVANQNQSDSYPKLVHYTEGGPYFAETIDCEYANLWIDTYNRINDIRSKGLI